MGDGGRVMTPGEADWVAANVLTKPALSGCSLELVRMCSCQYGVSGHCGSAAKHELCSHHGRVEGWPRPAPDTYVISRRGHAMTAVWRSGTPCVWRCSCEACHAAPSLPVPPARRVAPRMACAEQPPGRLDTSDQLALFDMVGAS